MIQISGSNSQFQHAEDHLTTNEITKHLGKLNSILLRNGLPAANAIRLSGGRTWTREEITQLEGDILNKIRNKDDIKPTFDCLRQLATLESPANSSAVFVPRSAHHMRLEVNPFRGDLNYAQQLIDGLRNALGSFLDRLVADPNMAVQVGPKSMLALILLSSVADLQLLDLSLQIALIEGLADRKKHLLKLNRLSCFVLSVHWRGQPDAERRLYIPDRQTARLISLIDENQVRQILTSVNFEDQTLDQRRNLSVT